MPHDHNESRDDTHHGPGDLTGWLRWARRRVLEADDGEPKPSWAPPSTPGSGAQNRLLPAAAWVVLVALAGLAVALGLRNRGMGSDPGPSYALMTKRPVRVYTAPSSDSALVTILAPGERVLATEPVSRRWGAVFEPDSDRIGYAYESDENFEPAFTGKTQPRTNDNEDMMPAGTTAICKDGWISHSKHRAGTCSSHGGVRTWVHRPPS